MNSMGAGRAICVPAVFRWAGAIGIVSIAVMRALTAFAPQVYFDVDPAIDPAPLAALGPAGSLWLDALLLLACLAALLGESLAGRGIEWKLLILAMVPAPIVLWHGWHDLGDLWRGSTWVAAAVGLVAIAHLARDRTLRIALLCALLAVVGPLLLRGLAQITIEHDATVDLFEQNKEQFMDDRGWEPGSSAAQIFERRLRQAQPSGWFTTTNIYASVMAAACVAFLGLMLIGAHFRRISWIAGAGLTLSLLAALAMTGSKGAMLAGVIGAGVVFACAAQKMSSRLAAISRHSARFLPITLLALLPLTLLGVVVRGAIFPEDFLGDRSLLFRWHYLVSSWDVFRHAPVLGVGPDGFQQAYTMFRLPRSPEEVMSAHSMFVDWLCTLGVSTTAWIGLVCVMLWRAGTRVQGNGCEGTSTGEFRSLRLAIAGVLALGVVPAMLVEQHVLDSLHLLLRVMGIAAYVGVALIVWHIVSALKPPMTALCAAAAAAVLMVHGQIEMTFFQPGSVVWAMCIIGLAGGAASSNQQTSRDSPISPPNVIMALALVGLVVWVATFGALPSSIQSARMAAAAEVLHPVLPTPEERIAQRRSAASLLVEAYELHPTNVLPLRAAIRQLELAAAENITFEARIELLAAAAELADRAVQSHHYSALIALRGSIHVQLAMTDLDPSHLHSAIDDLRRLVELDPHGIQPWRDLGNVLWFAQRHEAAAEAYEKALVNDANFELDPLKQMPESERETIQSRVNSVRHEAAR